MQSTYKYAAGHPKQSKRPRMKIGKLVSTGIARLLVLIYVLIILIPVYYLIISAFKNNQQIFTTPLALPATPSWQNFVTAQDAANLLSGIGNSLLITVCAELLTLILAVPAAYGMARIQIKGATIIERILGLGFLIPTFAVLFPTFLLSTALHLFHSQLFLIIFYPATALPLSATMIAQFMRSIPPEIDEAAHVDGATRWQILWRMLVPLSISGIATVVILNFLGFWNEYLFALTILAPDTRTVQVALPTLRSAQVVDYGLLTAGTLITIIPVYIVYAILQRRMQEAMVAGYAKG